MKKNKLLLRNKFSSRRFIRHLFLRIPVIGNKQWIFSRTSCFGNDVLKLLQPKKYVFNIQKGRIDFLLQEEFKVPTNGDWIEIEGSLSRGDVFNFIQEQHDKEWKNFSIPRFVFMDSYSDITDFAFASLSNKTKFAVNYFDVRHDEIFKSKFKSIGLIPLEELHGYYINFFSWIRDKYGNIPIVFLHTPMILEKRREYLERGRRIRELMNLISQQFQPLYIFDLPADSFHASEGQVIKFDDQYHFEDSIYHYFADQIKKQCLFLS